MTTIKFISGPYDGFEFASHSELSRLADITELPMSRDVLWALNGQQTITRKPLKAVAIYNLDGIAEPDPMAVYRFSGFRRTSSDELTAMLNWCNYVIRSQSG